MSETTSEILRTETLHLVRDGALAQLLDNALADAYADCADRPTLKKPRKIKVEISLTPNGEPVFEAAYIAFAIKPDFPAQAFERQFKAISKNKGFLFAVDTDSINFDADQQTFDNH